MLKKYFVPLCISLFAVACLTSCSKDDDLSAGDTYVFAGIENQSTVKGFTLTNGVVTEMSQSDVDAIVANEDVFTDLATPGATAEFLADNAVRLTDGADVLTGTYTQDGDDLSVMVDLGQGFSFTFQFEVQGDDIVGEYYSDYYESGFITSSSSGNPRTSSSEEDVKDQLTDEGDIVLYMEYDAVFTKQ